MHLHMYASYRRCQRAPLPRSFGPLRATAGLRHLVFECEVDRPEQPAEFYAQPLLNLQSLCVARMYVCALCACTLCLYWVGAWVGVCPCMHPDLTTNLRRGGRTVKGGDGRAHTSFPPINEQLQLRCTCDPTACLEHTQSVTQSVTQLVHVRALWDACARAPVYLCVHVFVCAHMRGCAPVCVCVYASAWRMADAPTVRLKALWPHLSPGQLWRRC